MGRFLWYILVGWIPKLSDGIQCFVTDTRCLECSSVVAIPNQSLIRLCALFQMEGFFIVRVVHLIWQLGHDTAFQEPFLCDV